ncbi:MAG: hypothetical protein IH830_14885, partial [Planctomycetes bacterium]|nr:hypothetical protein [Planctomycetota bacterium]
MVANWIEQLEVNPEWAEKKNLEDRTVAPLINHARTTNIDDSARGNTLFDDLLRTRDEQREQLKHARTIVQGKSLKTEINPMGHFRWYIHPHIKDLGSRALTLYVQEIPSSSRSGKQLLQGGRFHYVLEGKGRTIIDDTRHDWEKDDIILLPIKS